MSCGIQKGDSRAANTMAQPMRKETTLVNWQVLQGKDPDSKAVVARAEPQSWVVLPATLNFVWLLPGHCQPGFRRAEHVEQFLPRSVLLRQWRQATQLAGQFSKFRPQRIAVILRQWRTHRN